MPVERERHHVYHWEKLSVLCFALVCAQFWYNWCYSSVCANLSRSRHCCCQTNSHVSYWSSHLNHALSCQFCCVFGDKHILWSLGTKDLRKHMITGFRKSSCLARWHYKLHKCRMCGKAAGLDCICCVGVPVIHGLGVYTTVWKIHQKKSVHVHNSEFCFGQQNFADTVYSYHHSVEVDMKCNWICAQTFCVPVIPALNQSDSCSPWDSLVPVMGPFVPFCTADIFIEQTGHVTDTQAAALVLALVLGGPACQGHTAPSDWLKHIHRYCPNDIWQGFAGIAHPDRPSTRSAQVSTLHQGWVGRHADRAHARSWTATSFHLGQRKRLE